MKIDPVKAEVPASGTQGNAGVDPRQDQKLQKVAKDFESVLVTQVFNEMKDTIPDSELLEDDASKQMDSLFWMSLAGDVSKKGGFGIWQQLYKQMKTSADGKAKLDVHA
jgi:Rod binding domain-containing protein